MSGVEVVCQVCAEETDECEDEVDKQTCEHAFSTDTSLEFICTSFEEEILKYKLEINYTKSWEEHLETPVTCKVLNSTFLEHSLGNEHNEPTNSKPNKDPCKREQSPYCGMGPNEYHNACD